ncbi:monovalent cation/H+ antiporter complex subunit F [Jonesiaceae bacterium BS-20]|uniref:Monovalent cation/H+ antiporter complex subunit F n=1 Tax=Jonesiaceae bacterium BS-20 TaxID=3120821 RepID=A0AAU7DTA9_9MICO
MIVVVIICSVMLIIAGILALIRAERGPTMLNRTIALDVFATVLIGGIILEAAYSKRLDTLPILVVLSLVGFVGSVTIARFSAIEPNEQKPQPPLQPPVIPPSRAPRDDTQEDI